MNELRVSGLWLYPVKSMGGHPLSAAEIGVLGIPLDRGWAVRDAETGAVKSARNWPRLLLCSARYIGGSDAGMVPHVAITLPDGSVVNSDDPAVNERLSEALGKPALLTPLKREDDADYLAPAGHAARDPMTESEIRSVMGLLPDEPMPDLSGLPPRLMREIAELGAPRGTFFDAFPITVLTTSAVRHLQAFLPDVDLNVQRFRANIVLDDDGISSEIREHEWVGRQVKVGGLVLDVVTDAPRCKIIAAEQQGGILKDTRITRTIVREMRQCIAVYCNVVRPGAVGIGDTIGFSGA